MADNFPKTNEDVFVIKDVDNIIIVDPNKTISKDGIVSERGINQENFVMYANLEAQMLPRTKLIQGQDLENTVQTQTLASINFLRPGGRTFLDNTYTDQFTGQDTLIGKGINQPSVDQLSKPNKTDEFYSKQNTQNSQDTGLLGIESIGIKNTRSFTPVVDMVLIDTMGRALFEKGDKSEYAFFFNLPYPTFYLTIKGYYGKAIKYQLILSKFSAAFEAATGNYRITLQFYSYKYTILAETQIGALFATPFMYTNDFKITQEIPPGSAAAQTSVGDDKTTVREVRTTRGRQFISDVYKKYKALGLIDENFPEITFPELRAQLQALQKNLETTFGQTDFSPLTDCEDYFAILDEYRNSITDTTNPSSWISKSIDPNKVFYLKSTDNSKPTKAYIFNQALRSNNQLAENALGSLQKTVTDFETPLLKNKTLGLDGKYKIGNNAPTPSEIKKIQEIDASKSNDLAIVKSNSFVKPITPDGVDWALTFELRNKRKPVNEAEVTSLQADEQQFFYTILSELDEEVAYPTYVFVFDGPGQFEDIIDKSLEELDQKKTEIVEKMSEFLSKKIEGPNGLGFKPTMRNIMAIIFASTEAFYRLLNLVHRDAWAVRNNSIRQLACYGDDKDSPDIKQNIRDINQNGQINQEVYPWPLYLKPEIDENKIQRYVAMYPGEQSEISKTRASDYQIWPEVQFVEEYIRGLTKSQSISQQSGNPAENDVGRLVNRITVNAVDFPTTNKIFADLQDVKFLYEIYERVYLQTYWDRLSRPTAQNSEVMTSLSEMEVINIRKALNTFGNPSLIKLLKNTAFRASNYLQVLRNISNEGVGISWQQFIRGIFTSDYLRVETQKDFSIFPSTTISSGFQFSDIDTSVLSKVSEYVKNSSSSSIDFLDLYPFIDPIWVNYNLSNITQRPIGYNSTTKSLFLNQSLNFITNFEKTANVELDINRPLVNNSYKKYTQPEIELISNIQQTGANTPIGFNTYYENKIKENKFLITEGVVSYNGNTGNLASNQTVSMLNTPFFVNAFIEGVKNDRDDLNYPYLKAAYLFINSLPLSTLREPLKNIIDAEDNSKNPANDYLYATLTKFGAVHRLPYAWIIKYGSIWHRYKKFIETGEDILDSVWKNVDVSKIYYPIGNNLGHNYKTKDLNGNNISLYGQTTVTISGSTESIKRKYVGFYPGLINDVLFFFTGQNYFSDYGDVNLDTVVAEGLDIGLSSSVMRLPRGYDPTLANLNTSLDFAGWYTAFNVKESPKFNSNMRGKTIILPSFGTNYNQVQFECFRLLGTSLIQNQEIFNNNAVNDGSVRFFWGCSNFGYFDLSSIEKPRYDEYFNIISSTELNSKAFNLSDTYSNIEEIFGVFKTEILDAFELEFLKFSRSSRQLDESDLADDNVANRTFQQIFANCLVVDKSVVNQNTAGGTQTDYLTALSNEQGRSITQALQTFLNYNLAFRYGNPGNYDRRLFGSVTTNQRNRVFDSYDFEPYVTGTLPGDGSNIAFSISYLQNTQAWNTLLTYVGFATNPNLEYTDDGSFFTDFFITMNVKFTSENIKTVAPLVKLFGKQKLFATNYNYTRNDFVNDINEFYNQKENFLNVTLNALFDKLQKELPQVQETATKPLLSVIDGLPPKLDLWEAFKSFNDKWIAGSNFDEKILFQEVLFLDRANRDIGDVLVDPFKLLNFINSPSTLNARVIDYVSQILADNKFFMMPIPAYINWWGDGEVQNGIEPKSQNVYDVANNLFGIYQNVDVRYSQPAFLCYYVGNPSQHLDFKTNPNYLWKSDSFDLTSDQVPVSVPINDKKDWANSNRVVGFDVDFGTRNQNIFSSINLDQIIGASTSEANKVITEIAIQAGGAKSSLGSVSLYNLYKTRSYTVRVEALGCALLQPTMYFNLRNVPMFNGSYQIQSVEHRIEAGSFRTYFEGIRIPFYSLPKIDKQLISVNNNLLGELLKSIRRLKQTSVISSAETTNSITIADSIQQNLNYTTTSPVLCRTSIESAETPYNEWVGGEGFTTGITFNNFSTILKQKTRNIPASFVSKVRAMVFYTAYMNGHDTTKFKTYNFDLGGTPIAGYPSIPNINYGGLNKYLQPTYVCKQLSSGVRIPFGSFENFDKSIDFILNLWFTTERSNLLLTNKNINYSNIWQSEADYAVNMFTLWSYYWPRKRFQTPNDFEKWITTNRSSYEQFMALGREVYQKLKEFKLI